MKREGEGGGKGKGGEGLVNVGASSANALQAARPGSVDTWARGGNAKASLPS